MNEQIKRPVLTTGEHEIEDDLYFADPCPEPSLSASMAKDFIFATPLHAWTNSKRLNPFQEDKKKTAFDIGHAFHTMMLSRGAKIFVIDAESFRAKAAQEQRDEAYAMGMTPLLRHDHERVLDMCEAARLQLAGHDCGDRFIGADTERTLIWQEDGVWNRCKVDQLDRKNKVAYDLKSCTGYAEGFGWLRTNMRLGIDITVGHYLDGIKAVLGEGWRYRIVVVEKDPPHGLSVIELHPDTVVIGRKKVRRAREMLALCLRHNRWPAYPAEICQVRPPEWFEREWTEREFAEQDYKARTGKDVLEASFSFQAPEGFTGAPK